MMPNGEPMTIEFLFDEPSFQPHHAVFIKNFGLVGIDATSRIVDPVQYRKRVDDFDFDLVVQRFGFASTPGDLAADLLSSQAAALKGSQNLAGMSDPVIDALIERIIAAKDRPSLVNACKAPRPRHPGRPVLIPLVQALALDRLLGHVRPAAGQTARAAFPETWWYDRDKDKARAIGLGGTGTPYLPSMVHQTRARCHASSGRPGGPISGMDHRGSKDVVRQSGHIPTKRPIGSLPAHATTQRGRGMIGFE